MTSSKVESTFKDKILNIISELVFNLWEENEMKDVDLLASLTFSLEQWLNRGKIKLEKASVFRIRALTVAVKNGVLTQEQLEHFSQRIFALAPKWKGQVQTESLVLLNAISSQIEHQVKCSAYKLLSSMNGREGRNLAAQLLWKSLDNPGGQVRLNDNLLLNEEYKKLFCGQFQLVNFLFMFHYAASEVVLSESEFAERNAAGDCLRDVIKKAKKNLSLEDYKSLVDDDVLPVLSKGLMATHDRVQGEFIQVLTTALTADGHLGSLEDLQVLQSADDTNLEEVETNFFDNMRHLQKHR